MPSIAFPRPYLASLQELASTVLERRALGCDSEPLARDMLTGFFDVCMRSGLDGVLVALEQAFPPIAIADGFALSDDARLRTALVEKLDNKADFDHGGPRNAKPRQLAECLAAVLTLTLSDEPDRTVTLDDAVRAELMTALTGPVEVELAAPHIRAAIIAKGRELCDARYHDAFDRIAALLDERGMRMTRQPKIALDAVQAVQQALTDARIAIIDRVAHVALDRAKKVLARADADVAARLELPITLSLTPRDVAVRRASDARIPKVAASVVHSLFESLTELLHLAWRPLEQPVRVYAASQTFAVGDLLEHPKFGRGSVLSCATQRIEVEFPDGKHTLVHARAAT